MLDFRVGSNWLILCLLNFESCQLWHQDISSSISKICVPILLQISWILQNTPYHFYWYGFEGMRFFNLFLTYMVQKYQNEISPIFYYGKKLKTSGKLLKIPYLQPPDWGQPYWMTQYVSLKPESKEIICKTIKFC